MWFWRKMTSTSCVGKKPNKELLYEMNEERNLKSTIKWTKMVLLLQLKQSIFKIIFEEKTNKKKSDLQYKS